MSTNLNHNLITFQEMSSNKFEIKNEFELAPRMVKVDHPYIPCPGWQCDRGYLTMYAKPNTPLTPTTTFLRCSNSQDGCGQKTYISYGNNNCMECKTNITKVVLFTFGF